MKRDESPLSLRRPFVRLAKGILTPSTISSIGEALRHHVHPAHVADLLPKWVARDPQGVWEEFHVQLSNAYARIMEAAGRAARVRKDDRGSIPAVERAPEIMVPTNPYSAAWIKSHAGELCVEMSQRQHELVRAIVQRGYDTGDRPEIMAAQIERVIGLTSRQEAAVWNYRQRLDDEGSYDDEEMDAMADKYAAKQLVYRSETIARSENHDAVEHGRLAEWQQARDDGELPANMVRVWSSSSVSHRLCEICEAMDGVEASLDEDFVSPDGETYETAHAHPSCRCLTLLRPS